MNDEICLGLFAVFMLVGMAIYLIIWRFSFRRIIYKVRIYGDPDTLTLITYRDTLGVKKIWVYEKEWEAMVKIRYYQRMYLSAASVYLEERLAEKNLRPVVFILINGKGVNVRKAGMGNVMLLCCSNSFLSTPSFEGTSY